MIKIIQLQVHNFVKLCQTENWWVWLCFHNYYGQIDEPKQMPFLSKVYKSFSASTFYAHFFDTLFFVFL